MELLQLLENRRSIRKYTGEALDDRDLNLILEAGLLAPSGKNTRSCEFILIKERETLKKLSMIRPMGSQILADAAAAVVVIADTTKTDVWAEDGSIAMAYMHLMADSLGIGSCWVQGRLRVSPDERQAEDVAREILGFPQEYALEAILCLGMPEQHPEKKTANADADPKIHRESF